jgi:hypothetical protein
MNVKGRDMGRMSKMAFGGKGGKYFCPVARGGSDPISYVSEPGGGGSSVAISQQGSMASSRAGRAGSRGAAEQQTALILSGAHPMQQNRSAAAAEQSSRQGLDRRPADCRAKPAGRAFIIRRPSASRIGAVLRGKNMARTASRCSRAEQCRNRQKPAGRPGMDDSRSRSSRKPAPRSRPIEPGTSGTAAEPSRAGRLRAEAVRLAADD